MERQSVAWLWAGVGVVAVLVLVASGVWRQPPTPLGAAPSAPAPIIVEPIQPTAAAQLPSLPSAGRVEASAVAVSTAGAAAPMPGEGPERVKAIQQALAAAGYSPGTVDGKMGRMTQKAIREFQETHGLSVDGKVGPKTWAKLGPYRPEADASATSAE